MYTTNMTYPSSISGLFKFLSDSGFELSAPIDVDGIATCLGARIEEDDELEDSGVIGQITFDGSDPLIKINPIENSYPPRRRFTIAHELGHLCLHNAGSKTEFKDNVTSMSRSESYWNAKESTANNFAAQLLMPKTLLIEEGVKIINKYKADNEISVMPGRIFVKEMSDRFIVSKESMAYRLKCLGIMKNASV